MQVPRSHVEFQAIIVAGSDGAQLHPVTEHIPMCLLPIANRPLLHFQLDMIDKAKFAECLVITRARYLKVIHQSVEEWARRVAIAENIGMPSSTYSPSFVGSAASAANAKSSSSSVVESSLSTSPFSLAPADPSSAAHIAISSSSLSLPLSTAGAAGAAAGHSHSSHSPRPAASSSSSSALSSALAAHGLVGAVGALPAAAAGAASLDASIPSSSSSIDPHHTSPSSVSASTATTSPSLHSSSDGSTNTSNSNNNGATDGSGDSGASNASQSAVQVATVTSPHMRVTIAAVDKWQGQADALRMCHQLVHLDFFLLSADLITTSQLHHLADVHRTRDASMTLLLVDGREEHKRGGEGGSGGANSNSNSSSSSSGSSSSNAEKEKREKKEEKASIAHFIGLVKEPASSTNPCATSLSLSASNSSFQRVLFHSAADTTEGSELLLTKQLLRRHHQLSMHTRLKDMHLYLFRRWIIDLLLDKRGITSVQNDLVPYLVRHQFTDKLRKYATTAAPASPSATAGASRDAASHQAGTRERTQTPSHFDVLQSSLSMSHSATVPPLHESYRCYAYIAPSSSYCVRVTSFGTYKQANHDLAADPQYPYTPWHPLSADNFSQQTARQSTRLNVSGSYLGASLQLPQSQPLLIKNSIVGKECKIGASAKIQNCILFDRVTIEDGVTLSDSIVASGSVIGKNSVIKECRVGPNHTVPTGTEVKNDDLFNERDDEEEDDEDD